MATRRFSKRGRLVLCAAFLSLSVGLLLATGFDLGLLMVLPALTLVAVLLVWPHPGLDLIMRIAARRRPPRGRRVAPSRRPRSGMARGGRPIAASLGGRAPPRRLHPAVA